MADNPKPDRLLTLTEAAQIAGLSRQRISAAIKQGHLKRVPDVSVPLVAESSVREWMARPLIANSGRPPKPLTDLAACTCGAPGGRHRQPCPIYQREYRQGLRSTPGRPLKSPENDK